MSRAGRWFLRSLVVLFGVSLLSFLLAELAPGDYYAALREDPRVSPETVAALRARYGLDRPLPVRYAAWVASALRGEFGYSLAYNSPVGPLLRDRVYATLLLTGTATVVSWTIAIPWGVWSAARRGRWGDRLSAGAISALLTVPDLLLALALVVLAAHSGWLPAGGMVSLKAYSQDGLERIGDVALHLVVPVTVLVLGALPVLVRHVRASMLEAMGSTFALSARSHGIPRRRLLLGHLLPVAANPLISLAGFSFGALLSASLLVENVTGWPGLGPLFLEAILARDFPLVQAVVMLSTVFLICGNLLADALLYANDPRIRT
ncbi:MAG: ABC transporter permease [Acidobacteria bacterium]|nr:ABC transporter permease [Acidobacteriota bacterium]